MGLIKENIVGLIKFLPILLGLLLPFRQHTRVAEVPVPLHTRESTKYDALVGPSEPLVPTEPLFCPQCHVLVAHLRRTRRGIEIIQNNRVLVTVGGNIIVERGGKTRTGFPLNCPNGHLVEVQ